MSWPTRMDNLSYFSSEEEDDDDDEDEDEETEDSSSDSDDSSVQQTSSYYSPQVADSDKLEPVLLGNVRLALPQGLCENELIFNEFFSLDTWQNVLTEQQREELKKYLPRFALNNEREQGETVNKLFTKKNFKFGNPLNQLFGQLHNGFLRPDIVKMRSLMKRAHHREHRYRKRKLHQQTLKSLLISRRHLLVAALSEPPDTPPKVERLLPLPPPRISHIEQRARRRYFEETMQIRKSLGENSQSSEDENYPEGPPQQINKKLKKQLISMGMALSPDLAPLPSTLNTTPASPFQLESQVTCTFNPYEVTEESYKAMLAKHKKRRSINQNDPELNITGINVEDVSQRSQSARRTPIRLSISQAEVANQPRSKKKIKVEPASTPPPTFNSSTFNLDLHNSPSLCSEDSCSISFPDAVDTASDVVEKTPTRLPSISNKRRSSLIFPSPVLNIKEEIVDEDDYEEEEEDDQPVPLPEPLEEKPIKMPEFSQFTQRNNPVIPAMPVTVAALPTNSFNHLSIGGFSFKAADVGPPENMDINAKLEEATVPATPSPIKAELELTQDTHVCFLSLVRDIICSTPDQRMGLVALEQRLRGWQESPISPLNDWYSLAPSWVSLLPSAVNFLSGDFPAETQPEDFVPYLEYKPHMQAYQWIGAGRDSDHHLMPLCTHWLERRNEVPTAPVRKVEHTEEHGLMSPPPARCPTTWQVRKAMGHERENFHQQEKRRYENPHRAFTYRMHGYESSVGPMKGASVLGSGLTKPRGHTLLVPDRPNYVTILSLVRDAVARLPNGEGSRPDICELLRDSQYLVTGAEEGYLQSVVGGALDRLHFEVDTCVKYDPKRKIWVYLHRNRSEDEFERLHQQQSVQPKAKRPSVPRKTARARTKEKEPKPIQVVTNALASVLTPSRLPETTNLPASSPTLPSPIAPVKASPVATTVPRTFTLSSGALQNLQVATSTGVQTIQVSGPPAVAGGTSLLTSSAGQTVKLTTAAANKKAVTNLTALTSSGLTQQAIAAARLMVSGGGSVTVNKPLQTIVQNVGQITTQVKPSPGTILVQSQSQASAMGGTPTASTSAPLVLHPVTSQPRTSIAASQASAKTLLASVNAAQLVNVSQMQLVNAARAIQQQQTEALHNKQVQKQIQRQQQLQKKRQLQQQKQQIIEQHLQQIQDQQTMQGTKTVSTAMTAGMKLLNAQAAVKGSVSPMHGTQAIFIKHSGVGNITMPAVSSSTTPSSNSLKTEITLPLHQAGVSSSGSILISKAGSVICSDSSTLTTQASTLVNVTVSSPSTPTIMASRHHSALVTTAGGKPMVAKVLTNAQGQLISMESLLAQQKHQLAAATAGTARMAGMRPQQPHLIQLPGTGGVAQFAMVAPSGLVAPRLLQAAAHQLSQQQQAKSLASTAGLKIVTTGNTTSGTSAQVATSLNMATIGGQPVILASKGHNAMAGQNVFLASSAGGSSAVVLASPAGFRAQQGGTLLLQQGGTQQILLPHGFQAGTLNLKSLQSLQGIRVIPLAQASAAAAAANTSLPRGRQQVYARIITPSNKAHTPSSSTSCADGGAPTANEGQ